MRIRHHVALLTLLILAGVFALIAPLALAQDVLTPEDTCPALVDQVLAQVGNNCANLGGNNACYGYGNVTALFEDGSSPQFSTPTDRVSLDALTALRTSALDPQTGEVGVALLNVTANPAQVTGVNAGDVKYILFGDVQIMNAVANDGMFLLPQSAPTATLVADAVLRAAPSGSAPEVTSLTAGTLVSVDGITADSTWLHVVTDSYTAWVDTSAFGAANFSTLPTVNNASLYPMQAFDFSTSTAAVAGCTGVPAAMLVLQAPPDVTVDVVANGVPVRFSNTVFLRTTAAGEIEVINVSGDVMLNAGQVDQTSFRAAGAVAARITSQGSAFQYRIMNRFEIDTMMALEALPENVLYAPVSLPSVLQASCIGNCPPIVVPTNTPAFPSTPIPPSQPFPSPPLTVGTIGQDLPAEPWSNTSVGGEICEDWLVYHGDQTGSWEIYRTGGINLSQSELAGNIQPSLSPDREWVAFTSNRDDGNWELYMARSDGSEVRRVSWNTGVDINPVWGKSNVIVFESNRDANWELYTFDVSTGVTARLTNYPDGSDIDANWSPDGQFIVFSRAIDGRYELMLLNMTTFEETRLTDNAVDDIGAQFSNDGTKIAWLQRDASTGIYNLMMRDLTLPENQDDDLTNNIDVQLAAVGANINLNVWSPSDKFIAFDTNVDGDYDVFVVEIELEDGDTVRDIKNVTANTFQDRAPTFLCQSDIVIYQSDSQDDARNYDLFDVDATQGGQIEPNDPLNAPNQLTDLQENEIYAVNTITDEDGSREGRLP